MKGILSADSAGVKAGLVPLRVNVPHEDLPGVAIQGSLLRNDILRGPVRSPQVDTQWVRLHLSSTGWNWYMRKPGTYAGKLLTGLIESNGEVSVNFQRFRDIPCTDGSGERLETHYAISSPTDGTEKLSWMTPNELNSHSLRFNGDPIGPSGWALWQKIAVDRSVPATAFGDNGIISINLLNNGEWIEGP
jgi:hypothetical protein